MFRLFLVICVIVFSACGEEEGASSSPNSQTSAAAKINAGLSEPSGSISSYTKPVQTPWGSKEIYDPVKDPDFIEAFKNFRGIHHEQEDVFWKQYTETFGARHYTDFARIGCGKIQDRTCKFHSGRPGQDPMYGLVSSCRKPDYKSEYDFKTAMEKFTWSRCMVWDPYKDKPVATLSVETPWGIREIADPSKSLVVRKSVENRFRVRKAQLDGQSWQDQTQEQKSWDIAASNSFILAQSKFSGDIINLGCIRLIDSQCQPHIHQKLKFCEDTTCTERYEFNPPIAMAVPHCKINGEDHASAKVHDNVDEALEHMIKFECSQWRDEEPIQNPE